MRSTLRSCAAITALLCLSACAGETPAHDATDGYYNPALSNAVDQQLAQSTSEAAAALKTLAMIQRTRSGAPEASAIDESALPAELLHHVTQLNWSGPGDELTRQLASSIGYAFAVEGDKPASPALVSISINDESAARAFEDVGLQVQQFATLVVDPNAKRVTYRYETANLPEPGQARMPVKVTHSRHHRVHHHAKRPVAAAAPTGS